MKPAPTILWKLLQSGVVILLLALAACGDGGWTHWASYGVGYGCCGPVYEVGAGLPVYRLEPRSYWNYPDYRGPGPVAGLASRLGG
ncbi:hypothetical protein [Azospirillum isscasi]|uniref:Lipoprotein n=1 Tax=Azospirillum isscasi TaxID=3053926 RepID=A0ABU0WL84_9PROT|nr:hypothetical protein [Azospirillum isscasi]MDQ2104982.1 hypothetical protein [Azospirillum isscasi]